MFVGRASPTKGIYQLLEASLLVNRSIKFVFCLSTNTWDGNRNPNADDILKRIDAVSKERGNIDGVILNEWNRYKIATIYANAFLTVVPSLMEPFGNVAIESMSCGTPVIANAVGGLLDSVIHNKTGLLIDPGKKGYIESLATAIERLALDTTTRNEFSLDAHRHVHKNFTLKKWAHQHFQLYSTLLKQ